MATKRKTGVPKVETENSKDSISLVDDVNAVGAVVDVVLQSSELVQVVKPSQSVYFGPSLPNGKLNQFTVFKGELPRHVELLLDECPALKLMFVNPSKLNQSRVKLADSSSPQWASFQEVKAHFSKGVR